MPKNTGVRARCRALTTTQKLSAVGVAALGVATLALTAVPSEAQTAANGAALASAPVTLGDRPVKGLEVSVTDQLAGPGLKAEAIAARKKAAADVVAGRQAARRAKSAATQKAEQRAAQQRRARQAASRSAQRARIRPAAPRAYADNLDGWIRHALAVMRQKGIPGSYSGLHRNIMRESSGNPRAINNWDVNAANGIPSKGLLQVIPPTFEAYHVAGTSRNIYDPVANIAAAAHYAAHRYGSIDNVNSAY
ncbi:transglycosylase SLT domain-containing protein [Streptomyces sp. NPDC007264]|uniref:transglycosylase SLT domain-containing protein n=1 Tax=Streptomyces sp. NPDC007264 TaxID=3364777 RepID=UPI0036DBE7F1